MKLLVNKNDIPPVLLCLLEEYPDINLYFVQHIIDRPVETKEITATYIKWFLNDFISSKFKKHDNYQKLSPTHVAWLVKLYHFGLINKNILNKVVMNILNNLEHIDYEVKDEQ